MKIIDTALAANPWLGATIALVGGKRACTWLAWALLATAVAGIQSCRLDTAQEKNKTAKVDVKNLSAANDSNIKAIALLRTANQKWADAYEYDLQANETAIIGLRKDNEALTRGLVAAAAEREAIYAKYPKARAWGRTGADARIIDLLLDDAKNR